MEKDQREDKNSSQSQASQMITAGERSCAVNIPIDVIMDILKLLPVKLLVRLRWVSKEWLSIIGSRKEFIDMIVNRSLAYPQLDYNFIFHTFSLTPRPNFLFTSTYPNQIAHVLPFTNETNYTEFQYVRGLIGYWSVYGGTFTIHNPTTRQSLSLPNCNLLLGRFYLFGYDPYEKQYKVVCLPKNSTEDSCYVFTLGDLTKEWRKIDYNIVGHVPVTSAVCINGIIYCKAKNLKAEINVLLSFDVRSEEFNYVQTPQELRERLKDFILVDYQGKLGCICDNIIQDGVEMWVAEKQEWSAKTTLVSRLYLHLLLGSDEDDAIRCLGVTPGGEIVIVSGADLTAKDPNTPLNVCYYDPQKDAFKRVQIDITSLAENITRRLEIWAVPVHVENTMCL